MVAINFKERFEPAIVSGAKTQTIRPYRRRPFKAGDLLQLYTGLRTKAARKLIDPDPVCTAAIPIRITRDTVHVRSGEAWKPLALSKTERNAFARADGFANWSCMLDFFCDQYSLPFEGDLIKWRLRRRQRILLAQDDKSMREFLAKAFDRAGYEVIACDDGAEALTSLETARLHFDLLLADIVMPKIDGIELARQAAEIDPDLKIMFITGFAAVAMTSAPQDSKVLSKPFHLRQLIDEVRRVQGDPIVDEAPRVWRPELPAAA